MPTVMCANGHNAVRRLTNVGSISKQRFNLYQGTPHISPAFRFVSTPQVGIKREQPIMLASVSPCDAIASVGDCHPKSPNWTSRNLPFAAVGSRYAADGQRRKLIVTLE